MKLTFAALIAFAALITAPVEAQEPDPAAVLERFLGNWQTEVIDKAEPGVKKIDLEVCEWALGKKFVLGRQLADGGATKALWLMKYDAAKKAYPLWFFTVEGQVERLTGNWDPEKKQMVAQFNEQPGVKMTSRFIDRDNIESTLREVDDQGEVMLDITGKQTRQSAEAGKKILAQWSAVKEAVELDSETAAKTLDRLAGSWEIKRTYRQAEWFPKEVVTTSKLTRSWILDKRYLFGLSKQSDGAESLSLFTYENEDYQSYWFDAAGNSGSVRGLYPIMMGFKAPSEDFPTNLEKGLTPTTALSFPDDNHYVWTVTIKDDNGKKYFDGEWSGKRVK